MILLKNTTFYGKMESNWLLDKVKAVKGLEIPDWPEGDMDEVLRQQDVEVSRVGTPVSSCAVKGSVYGYSFPCGTW